MKIILVDENDNEIGFRERGQEKPEDRYRVSALWVTNSQGDILMARRAFTKKNNPGCWGPAVAGTIEEGETYESNIIKEAFEELGITISISELEKGPKFKVDGTHLHFTQWYFVTIDKPIEEFIIPPEEVAEIRWFTAQELQRAFKENPKEFIGSTKNWLSLFVPGI